MAKATPECTDAASPVYLLPETAHNEEPSVSSELEQAFTELKEFKVGELSRLCISRDFF